MPYTEPPVKNPLDPWTTTDYGLYVKDNWKALSDDLPQITLNAVGGPIKWRSVAGGASDPTYGANAFRVYGRKFNKHALVRWEMTGQGVTFWGGASFWNFDLPWTAKNYGFSTVEQMIPGVVNKSGGSRYTAHLIIGNAGTAAYIGANAAAGGLTLVSPTAPFTFAANDLIAFFGWYQVN